MISSSPITASGKKNHASTLLFGALEIVLFAIVGYIFYCSWRQYQLEHSVLLAFPGAEGFGATTEGGRFGRIVFVTNLFDITDVNSPEYPGSLRWAVDHTREPDPTNPYSERRIIVFRVGGIIELADRLIVQNPYITIAGQTAPGDGILLKGDEFTIATHDVIVRGIRVRVGDQGTPTCCRDGVSIGTYYANTDVYNVIVDHSSVSWAIDENFSISSDPKYDHSIHDITIQWNIISQGLYDSIHVDEGVKDGTTDPHSMGLIISDEGQNITVHHNLFSLNWGRNPRVEGVDGVEIMNNVIYGWDDAAVEIGEIKTSAHVIGNYFKPVDFSSDDEIKISDHVSSQSLIYFSDNFVENPRSDSPAMGIHVVLPGSFQLADKPVFQESEILINTPEETYQSVLDHAGATIPARDRVDMQVIDDVSNGKGSIINSQDEVGGWPTILDAPYPQDSDGDGIPDEWEHKHGSDPKDPFDASNYKVRAPSGYTWIEEYINSLFRE